MKETAQCNKQNTSLRTAKRCGLPKALANDSLQEFASRNLPQEFPVVVGEYGISVALHPRVKDKQKVCALSQQQTF